MSYLKNLYLKVACIIIQLAITNNLQANKYYFSSSTGNDLNTVLQAQNPLTPWQTLTKLSLIIPSLLPGDSVLFKCGDTFSGSFTISVSGSTSFPIVFSTYGSGSKPIITGLTALTSWTAQASNKWEAYCPNCGTSVNMLVLNDSVKAIGRHPNYNSPNKGYLNFESHIGNSQITDNQLTNTPNWTGAEVVIRKNHWIIDRDIITSHLNTTLSYSSTSAYSPIDNWGYFIQNHPSTLDQHGEWYYNSLTKKIIIYSNIAPSVGVSTIDTVIVVKNANYVTLNNLFIKGSNKLSCGVFNSDNIKIINCDIKYSGEDGFFGSNFNNSNFENNSINFTNNNGFKCAWGQNTIIKNNVIKNTATLPGIGKNGDGNYFGMYVDGNNATISLNKIDSVGYVALAFGSNGTLVKNNFINHYDLCKADGGGIYTYKGCSNVTYTGRKIIDNIVLNGISTSEGTDNPTALSGEGIYLDDNSDGVEIIGNTVCNCGNTGIFLHNAHEINVKTNTIYNCKNSQLYLSEQHLSCTPNLFIRNNIIKNNIFFAKTDTQIVSNLYTTNNDIALFGAFDSNYYCRPLNQQTLISANYNLQSLPQWQTQFLKDPNSKPIPILYPPYTINTLLGANKFANSNFNANTNGVTSCYSAGGNCNINWDNNSVLDNGSLKLSFTSAISPTNSSITYFDIGNIVANNYYILKFSLKGAKNNQSFPLYIQQSNTPWGLLSPVKYCDIFTTRTENEFLFKATSSELNASIIIQLQEQDSSIWLDNIELYEANVTEFNPDNNIVFEYNETQFPKTLNLNSQYIDVQNNSYSGNITLQPFTSIILLKLPSTTSTVGIATNRIENETNFTIYPNPASTLIHISSNNYNLCKILVYDITGREVANYDYSNTINVSNINNGIYILKIVDTNNRLSQSKKIIIQK